MFRAAITLIARASGTVAPVSRSADNAGEGEVVILSPHFDDAVLSCWQLLESPADVTVVNVFGGSPPPGTPVPWWDEATGATDPVERMRERRMEDRVALALAGRAGVALDLLDAQYRHEPLAVATVVARLTDVVASGALVYAPAGMSHHPDHELIRSAAIEMARAGWRLALYADLPHSIERGWPAWVTGETGQSRLGVAAAWSRVLAAAGLAEERLVAQVQELDAGARERKLRALGAYETQRPALDEFAFAPLEDPKVLAWEVSWLVPSAALRGGTEESGEGLVADVVGQSLDDTC